MAEHHHLMTDLSRKAPSEPAVSTPAAVAAELEFASSHIRRHGSTQKIGRQAKPLRAQTRMQELSDHQQITTSKPSAALGIGGAHLNQCRREEMKVMLRIRGRHC